MKNVAQSKPFTIEQAISRAKKAIKQGNTAVALELYNAVLQQQPNHPVAKKGLRKLQKGLLPQDQINALIDLYHSGQMVKTEQACRGLLKTYPQLVLVLNILGATLQGQGKLQEAVESYEKAIQLKPDYSDSYSNLGTALKELGQLEQAVESYEKAIQLKPDYADFYSNLGTALKELGQLERAVESYEKVIQLKPDFAEAYNDLGIALQELGQLEPAVESYEKAIQIKPNYAKAYSNLGNALQKLGQLEQAVESYEKAIQLKPNYAKAYSNCCNALQELGQLDKAVRYMQTAVERNPGSIQFSDSLVKLLNYHMPNTETRGPYAKIQESLQQVGAENTSTLKITDKTVRQLYRQCDSILASYKLDINTHHSQLYRGADIDRDCHRHKIVFDRFKAIPEYCFGCYKVTLEPRTVMELFKVFLLFDRLKLPNDNTRKCIVEVRPEISGAYKGLIYCQSLSEAKEILTIVQAIAEETIAKGIPIVVKRGCSEYQVAYPDYGHITDNGIQLMTYNEEWRKHEAYVDQNMILHKNHNTNNFTHNHSGLTLLDALVMRNWLAYAATIGDSNYLQISESLDFCTVDRLKTLMDKRPSFGYVKNES